MLDGIYRLYGTNDHNDELMCCEQTHLVSSKVKVTFHTSTSGFSDTCLCPAHNFVMLAMVGFGNNFAQMIIRIRQRIMDRNHVARSKVKVTVCS